MNFSVREKIPQNSNRSLPCRVLHYNEHPSFHFSNSLNRFCPTPGSTAKCKHEITSTHSIEVFVCEQHKSLCSQLFGTHSNMTVFLSSNPCAIDIQPWYPGVRSTPDTPLVPAFQYHSIILLVINNSNIQIISGLPNPTEWRLRVEVHVQVRHF